MQQQENIDESELNAQPDSTSNLIASENINETTSFTSPITNDYKQKLIENPIPISTTTLSLQQDNLWKNKSLKNQNTDIFASKIIPRVYLGTQMAADYKPWLDDHQITHILTISEGTNPTYPESYTYKVISVSDYATQNLINHFDSTHEFIQMALQEEKNNILIHCQAGVSRSSTVMIAYIMKSYKMSYNNAFTLVYTKRPVICPNSGFVEQLKLYESLGCQFRNTT